MKNRVSAHPNRWKLTNVSGDIYDLERADEPLEEGTPLNKNTLLKDETALEFDINGEPTPNKVFENLINISNQYLWRKYSPEEVEIGKGNLQSSVSYGTYPFSGGALTVDPMYFSFKMKDGTLELYNYEYVGYLTTNEFDNIVKSYKGGFMSKKKSGAPIYFINDDTYVERYHAYNSDNETIFLHNVNQVKSYKITKEAEYTYFNSTNKNKYREGYELLEKIGSPKYVFGTYIGDGQTERTIDLGFNPSSVLVYDTDTNGDYFFSYFATSQTEFNNGQLKIIPNGFSVKYNKRTQDSNKSREKYNYIAFR